MHLLFKVMENCALSKLNQNDFSQLNKLILFKDNEFNWTMKDKNELYNNMNYDDLDFDDIDIKEYRNSAESVFHSIYTIFRDGLNILYRLSNNALICWAFLEGAYTTYKLLCFIQKEMFIYYSKGFKKGIKLSIKLLIIFLKFLVLLIPKIIIFTLIYFLLYYKIEDYRFIFESKATFHHIITNIFKNGIQCDSQNNTIFPYFNFTQSNVFNYSIDNYKACYEFIYFYLNMFFSIFLFMIIMYTFFVFRSKIYELVIIILNLIWFFVSIIPVNLLFITKKYL